MGLENNTSLFLSSKINSVLQIEHTQGLLFILTTFYNLYSQVGHITLIVLLS